MTSHLTRSSFAAGLALAASVPLLLTGGCTPSGKTDATPAVSSVAPPASAPASATSADPPMERRGGDEILPVNNYTQHEWLTYNHLCKFWRVYLLLL